MPPAIASDNEPPIVVHNDHIHCMPDRAHFLLLLEGIIPNYCYNIKSIIATDDTTSTAAISDSKDDKAVEEAKVSENINLRAEFDIMSQISSKVSDLDIPFYACLFFRNFP